MGNIQLAAHLARPSSVRRPQTSVWRMHTGRHLPVGRSAGRWSNDETSCPHSSLEAAFSRSNHRRSGLCCESMRTPEASQRDSERTLCLMEGRQEIIMTTFGIEAGQLHENQVGDTVSVALHCIGDDREIGSHGGEVDLGHTGTLTRRRRGRHCRHRHVSDPEWPRSSR